MRQSARSPYNKRSTVSTSYHGSEYKRDPPVEMIEMIEMMSRAQHPADISSTLYFEVVHESKEMIFVLLVAAAAAAAAGGRMSSCWMILLLCGVTALASASSASSAEKRRNHFEEHQHAIRTPPGYWPRYSGHRKVFLLDGLWNSSRLLMDVNDDDDDDDDESSFDSMDPDFDPSTIATLNLTKVPSTVDNTLPGYLGYRGVSFFRTVFSHPSSSGSGSGSGSSAAATAARIQFQACSFYCRVWVNGKEIGDHRAGGYVAFSLYVPETTISASTGAGASSSGASASETTSVELFVLADNRFNATTAPVHTGGDFWHYGGILRSVEWHVMPPPTTGTTTTTSTTTTGSSSSTNTTTTTTISLMDDGRVMTMVWPWRLFVFPQADLKSVRLELQLTDRHHHRHDDDDDNNDDDDDHEDPPSLHSNNLFQDDVFPHDITLLFDEDNRDKDEDDHDHDPPRKNDRRILIPAGSISTSSARKDDASTGGTILDLGIIQVPNPRIWSTTDPQLHTISIELNGAIVQERFGMRYWDILQVATQGGEPQQQHAPHNDDDDDDDGGGNSSIIYISRIRLNGEILKLVGWNHHTQWPETAASPTDEQLDADIKLLQQGNANFVRGAHYPQDPRWLDRIDEAGMVMWCETLGPGVTSTHLQDEYFLHYQKQQMNEMLDNAMNHASIAFWAFFNEGKSNVIESCPGYQASSDTIQARDTTRFITYASNTYPPYDLCYDAATVISHNAYPGWYQSPTPADWWNRIANDLQAGKPLNAKGKPFLISETGASGIYEWINSTTNDTHTKWTIPYQTSIISQDVDVALANSNISGIALWHFFDFKVNDQWENNTHCDYLPNVEPPTCGYIAVNTSSPMGRPGGANHKGVLDFFRRPKPAYAVVAAKYGSYYYANNMTRNYDNAIMDGERF